MKLDRKKTIIHRRLRSIAFWGAVSIAAITPIYGSLAQIPSDGEAVNTSLVNSSEQSTDTAHEHVHAEHAHSGYLLESGRFTTNTSTANRSSANQSSTNSGQELAWPPQVKYVQQVTWDESVTQIYAAQAAEAGMVEAVAIQDARMQLLLGDRFTFISAVPIEEKWDSTIYGHKVTYFSYSNNVTVEAIVRDGIVESTKRHAATAYQPPLNQNEVDAAILIARRYWQEQGMDRVNELAGFTIQTFQPAGDGGYYDTRMTYVSFHVDGISEPELLTWVDLTNETVFKAAIDRGGE